MCQTVESMDKETSVDVMGFQAVSRRFGSTEVLKDLSFSISDGAFTAILGPSGCGKSTILRLMAGLDQPSAGLVTMFGKDVSEKSPAERNIAMVFQSYALYPHLTVAENIALPLLMRETSFFQRLPLISKLSTTSNAKRTGISERVKDIAEMLDLGELLHRKPGQLSGGQQQRVAVGRALVRDPALFLLDEPLSNLDAKLRIQMRSELSDLHRRSGRAFVYVTHDQTEAMGMADRILLLLDGRVVQDGAPRSLYEQPQNIKVAGFIGGHTMNFLPLQPAATASDGLISGLGLASSDASDSLTLGIRPEHLILAPEGPLYGKVEHVEYLGGETMIELFLDREIGLATGTKLRAIVSSASVPFGLGEFIRLDCEPDLVHVFDSETGARIRTGMDKAT